MFKFFGQIVSQHSRLSFEQIVEIDDIESERHTAIREYLGEWSAEIFSKASFLLSEPVGFRKFFHLSDDVLLVISVVQVLLKGIVVETVA